MVEELGRERKRKRKREREREKEREIPLNPLASIILEVTFDLRHSRA